MTDWRSLADVNAELLDTLAAIADMCIAARTIRLTDGKATAWTLDPEAVLRQIHGQPTRRTTADLQLPDPVEEDQQ